MKTYQQRIELIIKKMAIAKEDGFMEAQLEALRAELLAIADEWSNELEKAL